MNNLEVKEGIQYQLTSEQVIRKIDVSAWGDNPTSPSVKAYIYDTNEDVSTTVLEGSASVSGNEITLPTLKSLVAKKTYRIEVTFVISGNTLKCYLRVKCPF